MNLYKEKEVLILFLRDFFNKVKKLCKKHKILLAFDEVQSGIARTGKLFSYEWYGVSPDIMGGLAKGLGGGFPNRSSFND